MGNLEGDSEVFFQIQDLTDIDIEIRIPYVCPKQVVGTITCKNGTIRRKFGDTIHVGEVVNHIKRLQTLLSKHYDVKLCIWRKYSCSCSCLDQIVELEEFIPAEERRLDYEPPTGLFGLCIKKMVRTWKWRRVDVEDVLPPIITNYYF